MDEMKVESIVGIGTKVTMKKTIKKILDEDESNEFEFITKK